MHKGRSALLKAYMMKYSREPLKKHYTAIQWCYITKTRRELYDSFILSWESGYTLPCIHHEKRAHNGGARSVSEEVVQVRQNQVANARTVEEGQG